MSRPKTTKPTKTQDGHKQTTTTYYGGKILALKVIYLAGKTLRPKYLALQEPRAGRKYPNPKQTSRPKAWSLRR